MVADTKKVQTLINRAAVQAGIVREAVAALKVLRTQYQAAAPSLTGTPLSNADVTAISQSINTIDGAIGAAVWDKVIGAVVPTHGGKALD